MNKPVVIVDGRVKVELKCWGILKNHGRDSELAVLRNTKNGKAIPALYGSKQEAVTQIKNVKVTDLNPVELDVVIFVGKDQKKFKPAPVSLTKNARKALEKTVTKVKPKKKK